jgi:hypothetical protein
MSENRVDDEKDHRELVDNNDNDEYEQDAETEDDGGFDPDGDYVPKNESRRR